MKKLFIIFTLLTLFGRAEAQQFLNKRSIDGFMDKVREFTKDDNSYYYLEVWLMFGDGKFLDESGRLYTTDTIDVVYDKEGIAATVVHNKKQSFVVFVICVVKAKAKTAKGLLFNSPRFLADNEKDTTIINFGQPFSPNEKSDIIDSLNSLFDSLGF